MSIEGQKTDLLVHLLSDEVMATTLVFTRTKHRARNLAQKLAQSGFKATSLQGNLSQSRRQLALDGFKNGHFNVPVETDIAARGIDVDGNSHVINYDMPDTAEAYIHRTGRTGRATRTGDALTFATKEDNRMMRLIEQLLDERMRHMELAGPPHPFAAACAPAADEGQEGGREKSAASYRTQSTCRNSSADSRPPRVNKTQHPVSSACPADQNNADKKNAVLSNDRAVQHPWLRSGASHQPVRTAHNQREE